MWPVSSCMGERDSDITQITLDFEGLSVRISSTHRVSPKVAPNPRPSTSAPSGDQSPDPVFTEPAGSHHPSSTASAASPSPYPVSGELGLGPALTPKASASQPATSALPSVPQPLPLREPSWQLLSRLCRLVGFEPRLPFAPPPGLQERGSRRLGLPASGTSACWRD